LKDLLHKVIVMLFISFFKLVQEKKARKKKLNKYITIYMYIYIYKSI